MDCILTGTFGQVLECFDNKNKEAVAIKVIRSVNKYREAAIKWIPIDCSGFHAAWPNGSRLNAVDSMQRV